MEKISDGKKNRRRDFAIPPLGKASPPVFLRRDISVGSADVFPHRLEYWYAHIPVDYGTNIQGGDRPVLIISNDEGNLNSGTVIVLPLTTHMKRLNLPCHVVVASPLKETERSTVLVEQIVTLDKRQLERKLGVCPEEDAKKVQAALVDQLGLNIKA